MFYYVLSNGDYWWNDKHFTNNGFYNFYENPLAFVKHVSTSVLHLLAMNRISYSDILGKDREEGEDHNCGIGSMRTDLHCIMVFEYNEENDTCELISQEVISIEGVKKLYEITKNQEFYELLKKMIEGFEKEKFFNSEVVFPQYETNKDFQQFPLQKDFFICCSFSHDSITFGKVKNLKEIENDNKATYLFCKDINFITKQKKSYVNDPCEGCCSYDDDYYYYNTCSGCEAKPTKKISYVDKIDLKKSFFITLNGRYGTLPNVLNCIYYEGYKTFINRTRKRILKIKDNQSLYNSINSIIDDTVIKIEERHKRDLEEQKKREEEKKREKEKKENEFKEKSSEFRKMLDELK